MALVVANDDATMLKSIDKAKRALSVAASIVDVVDIRDKAAAIRQYVKASGESLALQNKAAELKLLAERKAGEMLAEMDKSNGGRPSKTCNTMLQVTLDHIGITRMQSSRWQLMAKVSQKDFESLVDACNYSGRELTQTLLLSAARKLDKSNEIEKPDVSEKETTLSLIASVRVAIAGFVDSFGPHRLGTLVEVLRSELEVLEDLNNGND